MSLTSLVPPLVPSLTHNSDPFPLPSSPVKKSFPVRGVRSFAATDLTSTVPAVVPSLFHSSQPRLPPVWLNQSVPLTLVRFSTVPFRKSTVPAAVPSLFQSPGPFMSAVRKKRVPFTLVRSWGLDEFVPGTTSATSVADRPADNRQRSSSCSTRSRHGTRRAVARRTAPRW